VEGEGEVEVLEEEQDVALVGLVEAKAVRQVDAAMERRRAAQRAHVTRREGGHHPPRPSPFFHLRRPHVHQRRQSVDVVAEIRRVLAEDELVDVEVGVAVVEDEVGQRGRREPDLATGLVGGKRRSPG
jgi:hypothetical protein